MGIIAQGIMQRIGQGHQAEEAQKGRDWRAEEEKKQRTWRSEEEVLSRTHLSEREKLARDLLKIRDLSAGMTPEERVLFLEDPEGYKSAMGRSGQPFSKLAGMVRPQGRGLQFGGQPGAGQQPMGPPSVVPQSMAPQAGPPGQMEPPEDIPLVPLMQPNEPRKKITGMPGLPGFEPMDLSSESDEDVEDFDAMELLGAADRAGKSAEAEGRPRLDIMESLGGKPWEQRTPDERFESVYPVGTPAREIARTHALFPQPESAEKLTAKQKEVRDPLMQGQRGQQQIDRIALIRERLRAKMTASGADKKATAYILGQIDKGKYDRSVEAQMLGTRAGEPPDLGAVVDEIYTKGMEDYNLQGGRGGGRGGGQASRGGKFPEAASVPAQHRKGYIAAREAGQTHEQAMQLLQRFMSGQAR